MKFSWRALLLAPLPVPVVYSILFEISAPGRSPILSVLILSVLGSVLSYATVLLLFLPCLFVVSRFLPLTVWLTGLIGTVLGGLVYLPVIWQSYLSSGADSGPPEGTFGEYLRRCGFQWDFWAFILAGLVTSVLYWFIVNQPLRRNGLPAA